MDTNQTAVTPKQILIAAKELVSTPDKWWHNVASMPPDQHCFITAISKAEEELANKQLEPTSDMYQLTRDFLCKAADLEHGVALMDFNDNPNTTHEQVLAIFDKAIEAATAKEGA